MTAVILESLAILALIVLNGLLSMSEMAIVTARKARLQQRADRGDPGARAALQLAGSPERVLSTVQVGITLIGILAGAVGGATIAEQIGAALGRVPWIGAALGEDIGVAVVVVVITYFSLVLGELAPKRLALQRPERIAALVARPMRVLSTLASPLIRLLSASTGVVLRLFGVRAAGEPQVTAEEINILVKQGTAAGIFEETEQQMVEGVFRLGDRRIGALITPRTELVWLDADDPPEETLRRVAASTHSWFPVAREDLDHVLGVVQAREILLQQLADKPVDLRAILQTPQFVPEGTLASRVLELFRQSRVKIVLVVDEYGGLSGLVTINDILEDIVGDLEQTPPQIVRREDGSWLVDGLLLIDEFVDAFELPARVAEDSTGGYQTVGGLVMAQLGRIPTASDHFEWQGLRFEVLDMDGNRVDKVLVTRAPEADTPPNIPVDEG